MIETAVCKRTQYGELLSHRRIHNDRVRQHKLCSCVRVIARTSMQLIGMSVVTNGGTQLWQQFVSAFNTISCSPTHAVNLRHNTYAC